MDELQFDRLARSVGSMTSRRAALSGVAAGILGAIGLGASLNDVDAQRRRRRNRNRRCGAQYAGCNENADCCTGLSCKRLVNPGAEAEFDGTCAYRVGCGRKNDHCDKNRDCCRKFRCGGKRCKRR